MTQRRQAKTEIDKLPKIQDLRDIESSLERVLLTSQDGTIPQDLWYSIREVRDAVHQLANRLEDVREVIL